MICYLLRTVISILGNLVACVITNLPLQLSKSNGVNVLKITYVSCSKIETRGHFNSPSRPVHSNDHRGAKCSNQFQLPALMVKLTFGS